jgi:hypothetical protein
MLLPAELLSQSLLPWVMAAPALPLAFMISRRNLLSGINVAILLASITTMLSNVFFSLIIRTPGELRTDIYLVGIFMEFGLAMALLWHCARHRGIRVLILSSGVMLCGAIASLIVLNVPVDYLKNLLAAGHLLVGLLALVGLLKEVASPSDKDRLLTESAPYWVQAGHLFHFGSMAIILFLATGSGPADWASQWDFSLLFTISTCIRFALLSTGVMAGRNPPLLFREPIAG